LAGQHFRLTLRFSGDVPTLAPWHLVHHRKAYHLFGSQRYYFAAGFCFHESRVSTTFTIDELESVTAGSFVFPRKWAGIILRVRRPV
jgi:hypothetical protein